MDLRLTPSSAANCKQAQHSSQCQSHTKPAADTDKQPIARLAVATAAAGASTTPSGRQWVSDDYLSCLPAAPACSVQLPHLTPAA